MVVVRRRSFNSYRNYLMDKEQGEKHPIKGSLCSPWWIQIQIPLTNNILCDSRFQPVHIREILPLTQEAEVFLFPHPTLFSCSTMEWEGFAISIVLYYRNSETPHNWTLLLSVLPNICLFPKLPTWKSYNKEAIPGHRPPFL